MISKSGLRRGVAAMVFLTLAVVPSLWAQKPETAIPLEVTFDNASGYAITGIPDAGDPVYRDALDNIRAEITYGNFYFDTNEMKGDGGRRVQVTLGLCAEGATQCPCPNGIPCPKDGPKDVYIATVYSGCDDDDLGSMGAGTSCDKRLAISWAEGTYTYYLRYDWGAGREGSDVDGRVQFCFDGAQQWTATAPSPTVGLPANAGLYAKSTYKRSSEVYLKSLNVTFNMTLKRK